MQQLFLVLYARDLRLAWRRPVDALLPFGFFVLAAAMFPLGIGPEPQTLRQIAPGVIWACALLATLVSLGALYTGDYADGTLEQLIMTGHDGAVVAAARAAAHWTITGLPLVLVAPVFGLLFDLSGDGLATLAFTLLLGTPVLSLLGSIGAALTLGLRSAGVLLILIVLPLAVPALIFGSAAVAAVEGGQTAEAQCSLLGALLVLTTVLAPPATAAALRIALD